MCQCLYMTAIQVAALMPLFKDIDRPSRKPRDSETRLRHRNCAGNLGRKLNSCKCSALIMKACFWVVQPDDSVM